MKLHLCKSRRRAKGEPVAVSHPAGDIVVEESENELAVADHNKDTQMDPKECIMKEINIDYVEQDSLKEDHECPPVEYVNDAPSLDNDEDEEEENGDGGEFVNSQDTFASVRTLDDSDDQLSVLLSDMSVAAIDDRPSFTRDFSNLQKYCNERLYELMADKELSLKCVAELVPGVAQTCLTAAAECQTFSPIVRGCLGIQDKEEESLENNEFRVATQRTPPDMPTIPTGIWVVDSINEALDSFCDGEVSKSVGNFFKLLNLTALLTYFGDSSGNKIAGMLSRTSSLVSRGPEAWREIIRRITTENPVEDKPLPTIPNASFVSKCETKLTDIPDLDYVQCGDGPFRVYWAYTQKWMRKHFNPAISNSKEMFDGTQEWFNSLEDSTQALFIRLSRTLCCYRP
ncbi:hypothetical protein X943_000221 [Babesia divergens]|uniref:Uncharacterized protein n=1 Tax=Babesia divergens TaxID=32595 RepID=A0AAD9GJ56_BABDI|nr:hypothetical protein X943_000221 [Babesia divergens]